VGYPTDVRDRADFPTIVTLCGSTRFASEFLEVGAVETLAGRIVLSIAVSKHAPRDGHGGEALGPEVAAMLDTLHKRKIDLSDEVLVLNLCGYIGTSTRSEVEYAIEHGKRVRWLTPEIPQPWGTADPLPPERHTHAPGCGSGWCGLRPPWCVIPRRSS
jgi:hypothetical protein